MERINFVVFIQTSNEFYTSPGLPDFQNIAPRYTDLRLDTF